MASQLLQAQSQPALLHRLLMQSIALPAPATPARSSQHTPTNSVWDRFAGSLDGSDSSEGRNLLGSFDPQKSLEEIRRQYLASANTRRDSTVSEPASEGIAFHTFHADDVALAERIAAVLMDRECVSRPSSDVSSSVTASPDLQRRKR